MTLPIENNQTNILNEFWRNGLPSLWLAVVTICLAVYSSYLVQPNIEMRYRALCDHNLDRLGLVDARSSLNASPSNIENQLKSDTKSTVPLQERKKLLSDTQLVLRRLAISDPTSDALRYRSALVAHALSDWYRQRAWDIAMADPGSDEVGLLLAGERNESDKAMAAMRTTEKLVGNYHGRASVWVMEELIRDASSNDVQLDEIEAWGIRALNELSMSSDGNTGEHTEKELFSAATVKPLIDVVLAKAKVLRALRLEKDVDDQSRRELLANANKLFGDVDKQALMTDSWRALSMLPFDADMARDWAWRGAQEFWGRGTIEHTRSEELDAVLRCLLVGGDFEETQSFAFNQLKKLPSFEQTRFRELAAATCIRQLVVNHLISSSPSPKDSLVTGEKSVERIGASYDFAILDLAVRLQPDVPGLPEVLISIGSVIPRDSKSDQGFTHFVKRVIDSSEREGLRGIVDAIRSAKSSDSNGVAKAIERVTQDETSYGVLATKVAMILVSDQSIEGASQGKSFESITHQSAVDWLMAINKNAPDNLSAWFARGSLHLNTKEFDQAIECFEFLAKRFPDSEQVQEMLETARAR